MRFLDGKEEIASLQEIGKQVQENARFTTFYGGHVTYKGRAKLLSRGKVCHGTLALALYL